MNIEKAKQALAALQEEKRAQHNRLQHAAHARLQFEQTIKSCSQLPCDSRKL